MAQAYGSTSVPIPSVMVDSGYQHFIGYMQNIHYVYESMVDDEMLRPPGAEVLAYSWRDGSRIKFEVKVKNLSGVNLSSVNKAAVHAIVWEDQLPIVYPDRVTSRYVRAAVPLSITLSNGSSGTYILETPDLTGVNWSNLHSLALVDYLPGETYDILQAGFGSGPVLQPSPSPLVLLIDSAHPSNPSRTLVIGGGPSAMTWTASESLNWLTVTPGGSTGGTATVQINTANLVNGQNSGTITFSATFAGTTIQQVVEVKAFYGTVEQVFLPGILR